MKRRPNPIPHDQVGPYGHEWWVWAAKWAPIWLIELPNPEATFTELNETISAMIDTEARSQLPLDWDAADQAVRQKVRQELMPRPEVTTEAWDDLDPMDDPMLDMPDPHWINPLAIDEEDQD